MKKEIARKQLEEEGKPQIIEKILAGKMNKFYEENCLVDQIFVKAENKETVKQYAGDIQVVSYTRYKVGDGIERKKKILRQKLQLKLRDKHWGMQLTASAFL